MPVSVRDIRQAPAAKSCNHYQSRLHGSPIKTQLQLYHSWIGKVIIYHNDSYYYEQLTKILLFTCKQHCSEVMLLPYSPFLKTVLTDDTAHRYHNKSYLERALVEETSFPLIKVGGWGSTVNQPARVVRSPTRREGHFSVDWVHGFEYG